MCVLLRPLIINIRVQNVLWWTNHYCRHTKLNVRCFLFKLDNVDILYFCTWNKKDNNLSIKNNVIQFIVAVFELWLISYLSSTVVASRRQGEYGISRIAKSPYKSNPHQTPSNNCFKIRFSDELIQIYQIECYQAKISVWRHNRTDEKRNISLDNLFLVQWM